MGILGYIIIFTLLGSIVSLIGGIALLTKEKFALKISHFLASFAAGALLGTAFFDLLPEAAHEVEHVAAEGGSEVNIFVWTLIGMLAFFLLERFIHWFHHHHDHTEQEVKDKTVVSLVLLGDTAHNFIDGVVIAATFMVSIPLGIVTTLAVAAHEIPQEVGDFGILLHKGLKRSKILLLNIVSSLAAVLGALITYSSGKSIEGILPIFLSLAAGFFIYIAASDLIPEIHNEEKRRVAVIETLLLLLGVLVVYLAIGFVESLGLH